MHLWLGIALALTATASRDPVQVSFFGAGDPRTTSTITHRLDLQAGGEEERFYLAGYDVISDLTVTGPLTLSAVGGRIGVGDDFGFPGRDGCPARSGQFGERVYAGTLPAGASARVAFTEPGPARAVKEPSVFAQSWALGARSDYFTPPSSAVDILFVQPSFTASEPAVQYAGLAAKELQLFVKLNPSAERRGARTVTPVKRGRRVIIKGSLLPEVGGERVRLWAFVPGRAKRQLIATVRTNRVGDFGYRRFRVTRKGRYELLATFAGDERFEPVRSPCGGPQLAVRG